MLDPNDRRYWEIVARAYHVAGMPPPDVPLAIPLPVVVARIDPALWVDPEIWRTGDAMRISQSVFDLVGPRPPIVPVETNDDILPTRAIFLTTGTPFNYTGRVWPGAYHRSSAIQSRACSAPDTIIRS
jgi:hypothetical protein